MIDFILAQAGDIGGFIVVIIWAAIALISYLVKRKQEGNDEDWEEEEWDDSQTWNPEPKPKPKPQQQPTVQRQEPQRRERKRQPPPAPQASGGGDQRQKARTLIQEALDRQQKRLQEQSERAAAPPPLPGVQKQTLSSLLPSSPSAPSMPAMPTTPPGVTRRRTGRRLQVRGAKGWRQAIMMREVLERPRAYDT